MTAFIQDDRAKIVRATFPVPIFLALAVFFGAMVAAAQDAQDVIKIETDLAAFEISVTDPNGRPVRNLTANDFRVFEDGVERTADFFEPIRKEDTGRPL